MKFIIHQLKIWFDKQTSCRVLDFEPNKVNIVTGDSSTGKTNIVAIIDYCLLSEKNNIVEQIINENSEWYSILLTINDTKYFIARKKENLGQESSSICLIKDGDEPEYPFANISIDKARNELNVACGITNTQPLKKVCKEDFKISYRTNLMFNYLTERVISLDNIYFDFDFFDLSLYANHEKYIVEKAMGFDYVKLRSYEEELKSISERNNNYKSLKSKELSYKKKLQELVDKAVNNGLIDNPALFDDVNEFQATLLNMVSGYNKALEEEKIAPDLTPLRKELSTLKIELNSITTIEDECRIADDNISKFEDVLLPIKIIQEQSKDIVRSFETQQLIDALEQSLQDIRKISVKKTLKHVVSEVEKAKIVKRIDEIKEIVSKPIDKDVNLRNRSYYAFVAAMEISRELKDIMQKRERESSKAAELYVENFVVRSMELADKINSESTRKLALNNSINCAMQLFFDQLSSMGVYSDCELNFNMDKFIVQLKEKGKAYPYGKIGSKSNDMFLHLCCYLGFHKLSFDMNENQTLFPFMFIDQPSIPYYSGSERINNDDKTKLIDAFKLLNNFIDTINNEYNKDFQIILTEHAPTDYWEKESKLSNFHTVAVFTEGEKLIPMDIVNK